MAARCAWRWEASLAPAAAYGAGTDESGCGGRVALAVSHGGRGDGTNRRAPPWDWGRAAPDLGVGRVDPAAATSRKSADVHAPPAVECNPRGATYGQRKRPGRDRATGIGYRRRAARGQGPVVGHEIRVAAHHQEGACSN